MIVDYWLLDPLRSEGLGLLILGSLIEKFFPLADVAGLLPLSLPLGNDKAVKASLHLRTAPAVMSDSELCLIPPESLRSCLLFKLAYADLGFKERVELCWRQ